MAIRGMSFQKGIIFIGKKYITCAYESEGEMKDWIVPIKFTSFLKVGKHILFSMPKWFYIFFTLWMLLILLPHYFGFKGLPDFSIIYFLFGTHFWFPTQLKKFHGAEHKIFSYQGIVSERKEETIKQQAITNKYCSTNAVVVFFLSLTFLCIFIFNLTSLTFIDSLEFATYLSVFLSLLYALWQQRLGKTFLNKGILGISYLLQRHVTTQEPEDKHIKVAIHAFRLLGEKEFPQRIREGLQTEEKKW